MDTVELLQELERNFPGLKQYHFWILLGLIIALGIFQVFHSVWVRRNVSRLNSKLKEKEIRFSKFHDLQVDNLQKLYSKLIDLSYANRNLFSAREESNNHLELRKRIRKWDRKYIEVHYFFHQNRIF